MVTTSEFIALCLTTAIAVLLVYRMVPVRMPQRVAAAPRPREKSRSAVSVSTSTRIPRHAMHKLHWISATQLSHLITTDPDLVLFHLVDGGPTPASNTHTPSQLAISLEELEETLPWIPYTSRVAIYRNEGIDMALARKLSALMRGREALLLSEMVPPITEKFNEMAGERCN